MRTIGLSLIFGFYVLGIISQNPLDLIIGVLICVLIFAPTKYILKQYGKEEEENTQRDPA